MSETNAKPTVLLNRLERRLEVTGLSAWEASRRAGLSHDAIRDIQRGKTLSPRPATIKALADVLECDPQYLSGEYDVPRKLKPPRPNTAVFEIDDDEVELLILYRQAKEFNEADRIRQIAKALVHRALSPTESKTRGKQSDPSN